SEYKTHGDEPYAEPAGGPYPPAGTREGSDRECDPTPGVRVAPPPARGSLECSPALDQLHHRQDDGDDQQHVDEPTQGIGRDHAQQPEHQEDHEDRPQHDSPSSVVVSFPRSTRSPSTSRHNW